MKVFLLANIHISQIIKYFITFFSSACLDFAAAQKRQYDRLTKEMKPDLQSYEKSKKKLYVFKYIYYSLKYAGAKSDIS